jgi:integrative and conjugative element protein (TIGR02256 family)
VIFRRIDSGMVKLDSNPLKKVMTYRQMKSHAPEAGGILLGRHIIDSEDIVVDLVTTPYPGDVRKRCLFTRRSPEHQNEVNRVWEASCGTCTYLGEWHTHAEGIPHPSSIDLKNWQDRLKLDTYEGSSLFFVIVGITEIHLWEASQRSNDLSEILIKQLTRFIM